jgi:hypothetical protein
MTEYKAYRIKGNHILGPPGIIMADNDQQAAEQAKQMVHRCDVELWEGSRLVMSFKFPDRP